MTFTSYQMVVQAAQRGLGVAIGWHHCTADLIREGSLVRPVPEVCQWDRGHYVVVPADRADRPEILAFCAWLKAEIAVTLALSPSHGNHESEK